jgi:sugar transferase (PEP-CTERM/EpsH1 system associated)
MTGDARPLVLHVIHRLATGGLENGLVNLINHMSESKFRHAVACIEDYSEFRQRLVRRDTEVFALDRSRVGIWEVRRKVFVLCRRLRPTIVHSRNMSGLDALLPARLAGVRYCVHGEHGWDVDNLNGEKLKPALLRRLHAPLVSRYITVSKHLERYLISRVGIPASRISQIYNGVDTQRFAPGSGAGVQPFPSGFAGENSVVIGTVGRIQAVKDQATLVRAFAELVRSQPEIREQVRLAIVGDGPLLTELHQLADALGITAVSWFPGAVRNVPEVLRAFDVFVLPSLSEGISNTILEAMASGLPILATAAGGNVELVEDGRCGHLFQPGDVQSLTRLLAQYVANPSLRLAHGNKARQIAVERFGLPEMVAKYQAVYERLCGMRDFVV